MSKILEGLNTEQKEAVTTTEGPLLVIAGAGTGKTTVITRRIAYLIEQKLAKPSEILSLTFTEKAAAEMEERVDVLVPYGYIDTWISTFHAFGDRVLHENALDLGLPPDFKILTRPAQILFFRQNLFSFDLDYFRPLSNPTKFIEAILSFFSRCKDEDISPEDYAVFVEELEKKKDKVKKDKQEEFEIELKKQKELSRAYTHYEKIKSEAGLLDFGDQVLMTLRLFRARPGILKKYQEQFKYILVDEFQDTNWTQNELVSLLSKPKENVCVVADDDQSIYRFRGAAISNVLEFKKQYPKVKIVTLTKNYRSTQRILDAAYKLIVQNNPDRLEVAEGIDKHLVSQVKGPNGESPVELYCETMSQEANSVAEEIVQLTKGKKRSYKDIAILVRANAHADSFLKALNLRSIPSRFVGSSGLYSQSEIQLLISFLYSIADSDDSLQLFTLATSDIYRLPMNEAIKATSFARRKGRSLRWVFDSVRKHAHEIDLSSEAVEVIEKLKDDIDFFLDMARKENAGKVLYEFLKKTKYLTRLDQEASVQSATKIQNIARFFDKIAEFNSVATNTSIRAFVEWLEMMRSVGDDPATAEFDPDIDAVTVMTVHAAKGLEFPVVFMVGLVAESFPSRERKEAIPLPNELVKEVLPSGDFHLQEERRLFYVGMTRAMQKLYFTWSRDMGGKRVRKVSPFVFEALDKVISETQLQKQNPIERIEQFGLFDSKNLLTGKVEPKIIRLSQGSIDDYQTCAYKYRYIHVLRLPIAKHHAVIYGSALHVAVAEYYRQKITGKLLGLDELLTMFENSWVSEGFLSLEHEEQRLVQGKKVLSDFWDREREKEEIPTFVEKEFKFSVGDSFVAGRFDRVDVRNDEVKIIDFKSTQSRSKEEVEKAAKESLQMRVYALAYFKNYKQVPNFVGIYDLESGYVGGYKPTKELLKDTEELISETDQNIRENLRSDDFPANPKYFGRLPACHYCAYNSICPFSLAR